MNIPALAFCAGAFPILVFAISRKCMVVWRHGESRSSIDIGNMRSGRLGGVLIYPMPAPRLGAAPLRRGSFLTITRLRSLGRVLLCPSWTQPYSRNLSRIASTSGCVGVNLTPCLIIPITFFALCSSSFATCSLVTIRWLLPIWYSSAM